MKYNYIVVNSYTPESEYESGIDIDYFETLEQAKAAASPGDTIAKIIEEV